MRWRIRTRDLNRLTTTNQTRHHTFGIRTLACSMGSRKHCPSTVTGYGFLVCAVYCLAVRIFVCERSQIRNTVIVMVVICFSEIVHNCRRSVTATIAFLLLGQPQIDSCYHQVRTRSAKFYMHVHNCITPCSLLYHLRAS